MSQNMYAVAVRCPICKKAQEFTVKPEIFDRKVMYLPRHEARVSTWECAGENRPGQVLAYKFLSKEDGNVHGEAAH
jgi:hypothetical protein